jgi:hypothetical protein
MDSEWREGLFESFDCLIEIIICNRPAQVPDNNTLLRCFQYLNTETISVGEYCWNGECINCQVWYESEDGEIRGALACRMYVRPDLIITSLSANLKEDMS